MAYQHRPPPPPPPPYHPHPHSPSDPERKYSAWDPPQRSQYPPMSSTPIAPLALPGVLDPESESSEVSDTGEEYHGRAQQPTYPTLLPPPLPKHAMESQDAIQSRLHELNKIEDYNIKRLEVLKAKRARKDEKIRRKRDAQDHRIRAIMEARTRHDDRIHRRRKLEDDAFERVDHELEEEETNLRRRMKRLKRGLPMDEIMNHERGYSPASMSPPGPSYATIPPPAKRHQAGPPGQSDSPINTTPRPVSQTGGPPSGSPSAGSNIPSYSFLQSAHAQPPPPPPAVAPYGRSPTYSHTNSPLVQAATSFPSSQPPTSHPGGQPLEPIHYGVNGYSSPHMPRSSVTPLPSATNSVVHPPPPATAPPRATYDTRPPPSTQSGFPSVNQPPPNGFAAINSHATGTPPAQPLVPGRDQLAYRGAEYDRIHGLTRPSAEGTPPSTVSNNTPIVGKRTPSTTHPYQMSEAFANRHHHCERTDGLNRGIWTYYGPGGTQDKPTAPAKEMYLRCNHDGCTRIDWRTVHGLQCHIVKNHEQPKGTIGSLEKALDKYGVAVSDIEAYEREHGEGRGGSMADPKNLKLKTKARESSDRAEQKKWIENAAQVPLATYSENVAIGLGGQAHLVNNTTIAGNDTKIERGTPDPQVKVQVGGFEPQRVRSSGGFAAVNGAWDNQPMVKRTISTEVEMGDAPPIIDANVHQSRTAPSRDEKSWHMLPPNNENPSAHTTKQVASNIVPVHATTQSTTMEGVTATSSHLETMATPHNPIVLHVKDLQPFPPLVEQETNENAAIKASTEPVANQTSIVDNAPTEATGAKNIGQPSEIETSERPRTADGVKPIETQKETPKANKVEIEEGKRSAVTSPDGSTRRISMTSRRGSSRRASLAASKVAEKEKELQKAQEREEEQAAAAAAAAATAAETITLDPHNEKGEMTEPEGKPNDKKEDIQNHEEHDESIITVQVTSNATPSKKDKEKDDTGGRTSKRLTNSRYVSKKR